MLPRIQIPTFFPFLPEIIRPQGGSLATIRTRRTQVPPFLESQVKNRVAPEKFSPFKIFSIRFGETVGSGERFTSVLMDIKHLKASPGLEFFSTRFCVASHSGRHQPSPGISLFTKTPVQNVFREVSSKRALNFNNTTFCGGKPFQEFFRHIILWGHSPGGRRPF